MIIEIAAFNQNPMKHELNQKYFQTRILIKMDRKAGCLLFTIANNCNIDNIASTLFVWGYIFRNYRLDFRILTDILLVTFIMPIIVYKMKQ